MQVLDRMVSAVGGKELVAARPGIGYLVFEVVPAFVFMQITGAGSQEFFYFIAFLHLLGASDPQLALLPMVCTAAGVAQVAVVVMGGPGDDRRRSIMGSWWVRSVWAGTLIWPLLCMGMHWGVITMLSGVFGCVFIAQVGINAATSSFVSWTQDLVPRQLRGIFYGWRMVNSFVVVGLVLWVVSWTFPSAADPHRQLFWLMGLLGGATVVGIAGTLVLARSPAAPAVERPRTYGPLWAHLQGSAALKRMVLWSMATTAAGSISVVYQSVLYLSCGTSPKSMALWQAMSMYPSMLLAIVAASWALPRIHGRPLLVMAHIATILAESCLLFLTASRLPWMLPCVLCLFGLAKGVLGIAQVARLQELLPPRDPRIYSLFIGLSSLMGLLVTFELPWLVAQVAHRAHQHPWITSAPWAMVLLGVLIRILATPLLLRSDQTILIETRLPMRLAG